MAHGGDRRRLHGEPGERPSRRGGRRLDLVDRTEQLDDVGCVGGAEPRGHWAEVAEHRREISIWVLDRGDHEAPRSEVRGEERRLQPVAREAVAEDDEWVRATVRVRGGQAAVGSHRERLQLGDLGGLGGRQPSPQVVGRWRLVLLVALEAGVEDRDRHRSVGELGDANRERAGLGVHLRLRGRGERGRGRCQRWGGRRCFELGFGGRRRRRGGSRAGRLVARAATGRDQRCRECDGQNDCSAADPHRGKVPHSVPHDQSTRRMTMPMPAVSLAAVPGKRLRALETAVEIERRGFAGIYCPSLGDALGSVHLARARDFDHPVRHGDRADLLPSSDVDGLDGLVHPRGERWPVRSRARREPWSGARPTAARRRQAALGHAGLRGSCPRSRARRRATTDRVGDTARPDGRARGRDRRRRRVGQRVAEPHGGEPRARSPRSDGRRASSSAT